MSGWKNWLAGPQIRLLKYLRPYWLLLVGGVASVLVVVAGELTLPLIFGRGLFDEILLQEQNFSRLNLIVGLVVGLYFVKGLFRYGTVYLLAMTSQQVVFDIRQKLFDHLTRLSLAFHERRRTGEMVSRVTSDMTLIQNSLMNGIADFVHDILILIGIIGLLLYLQWQLAVVTLLVLPLVAYAINTYGNRIRRYSRQVQERVADIGSIVQEAFSGIRVVKAFTMEQHERERFSEQNRRSFWASLKSAQMVATVTPVVELLMIGGVVVVLWYGSRAVMTGRLTPGELVAFLSYVVMVSTPINGITRSANLFQQAFAAAERIFEMLDQDDFVRETPGAVELPRVEGRVEYDNVSFAYREGQPVLIDINLTVEPGEIVALVGPSGAGKSTLVNLLSRFYDPTSGAVRVDGYDLQEVTIRSLRDQIGLVPQETVLFGATVMENIAYGSPGASEEEIVAAAKMANAHQFICDLPEGYHTKVGERGASLSGGQRQRIAIARAILRDPRILILDEATSALDTESEIVVQEALNRLMEDRTTFVIAHRLSTIRSADKIVVLDRGRIVESGSHQELLERQGLYYRLHSAQFASRGTETVPAGALTGGDDQ